MSLAHRKSLCCTFLSGRPPNGREPLLHVVIKFPPANVGEILRVSEELRIECEKLTELPYSIGQLHALRHLEFSCSSLRHLPETSGQLNVLRHLESHLNLKNFGDESPRIPNCPCGPFYPGLAVDLISDKGCVLRDSIRESEMQSAMGKGTGKDTILRIKRKRDDAPFESLWLEVTSRPIKRHEPNLAELSLGDVTAKPAVGICQVGDVWDCEPSNVIELFSDFLQQDEGASSKLLFRRVETLSPSGVKEISLPEFLLKVKDKKKSREKQESWQTRNNKDKQGQLLAAAKEDHETQARTARFQQVWRSRRRDGKKELEEDPMQELFHLYDVVHLDEDAESAVKAERRKQAKREAELKEGQLLCNYLPMLREVLPEVAAEIEDLTSQSSEKDDGEESSSNSKDYVYDVYTLDEEVEDSTPGETITYPIIQIMDDEDHDWQEKDDPDYDSEDSNDENNPNNDYPEEEDDEFAADEDSNSDSSYEVNPYSMDNEEYDTVLSDEERDVWRPRR